MLSGAVRYLLYAIVVAAVPYLLLQSAVLRPESLSLLVNVAPIGVTTEYSSIELSQNFLIVLCALIFSWIAWRDRLRRPLAIVFVALFSVILVRELDFFLDRLVADNCWQVLVTLIIALSGVYIYRHLKRLELGWYRSWPSAGIAMIIAGAMVLIPFSLIVAHEEFWQAILGDEYTRQVKVAVEELVELGGYLIMTIGSFEFLYEWSRLPKSRAVDRHRQRRRRRK